MDELQMTVESLIDLDEPEALLETLKRAAARKKGERWSRLALALSHAQSMMEDGALDDAPADLKGRLDLLREFGKKAQKAQEAVDTLLAHYAKPDDSDAKSE